MNTATVTRNERRKNPDTVRKQQKKTIFPLNSKKKRRKKIPSTYGVRNKIKTTLASNSNRRTKKRRKKYGMLFLL